MSITRRDLLKSCAAASAAFAAPAFVPAHVLGATAPSNRITIGMIGMGRQCIHVNLAQLLAMEQVRVVAVCDADRWRMNEAARIVNERYGDNGCRRMANFEELLALRDLDAVMISTPDHWHVPMALAAVRAGKHVCCEKPLTRSIVEGRVLSDAARKAGVVFRTDSECRSNASMRRACELVINGYIGNLKRIEAVVPGNDRPGGDATRAEVPDELDYEAWVGPARMFPYARDRVHPRHVTNARPGWMTCGNTCDGVITNWGTHIIDIVQWARQMDHTGPVSVEASGMRDTGTLWDVWYQFNVQYRYGDGVVVDYRTGQRGEAVYTRFEGDEGWVTGRWFPTAGVLAGNRALTRLELKSTDVKLPSRMDKEDFIHAIRTGEPTMSDAEAGHRTCSMCLLGKHALDRGKRLEWDPAAEKFTNDEEANRHLDCERREPYTL